MIGIQSAFDLVQDSLGRLNLIDEVVTTCQAYCVDPVGVLTLAIAIAIAAHNRLTLIDYLATHLNLNCKRLGDLVGRLAVEPVVAKGVRVVPSGTDALALSCQ